VLIVTVLIIVLAVIEIMVEVVCLFCMAVLEGLSLVGPGKSGRWVLAVWFPIIR
jgi:hypothetical protein